jgi:hypothetical protein
MPPTTLSEFLLKNATIIPVSLGLVVAILGVLS